MVGLTASQILTFLTLARYARDDGLARTSNGHNCSITYLMKVMGKSRSLTGKLTRALERAGLISVEKVGNKNTFYINTKYCEHITKESKWRKLHRQYLMSPQWKELREKILTRDNHECIMCGSSFNLHVHHLTYEHFTHEQMDDLITLCSYCHSKIHNKIPLEGSNESKNSR